MRTGRAGIRILVAGVALLLVAGNPARAQELRVSPTEARVLREASALEARGRHREAEERVRALLARDPASAAGVFALDRTLRAQGRLADVLPAVEAYLTRRPDGEAVRALQLRVLAELDSLDALRRAGRSWIERDPGSLETYREVVRAYGRALGPEVALEVVGEARDATGRPEVLALAAGDLKARAGDPGGAVEEWARAVEEEETSLSGLLRRVGELPEQRRDVVGTLVDALAAEPTTTARLRAAARLAVEAELDARALETAERVLPRLDGRARKGFLLDLVRRAEGRGGEALAVWGYEALREEAESPGEARALNRRIVEMALASGDTLRAVSAQEGLVAELGASSAEGRRARATLIRLEASSGRIDQARERLEAFRRDFPEAPERDELAASVARALVIGDRPDDAVTVLDGETGPESALERAYLLMGWEDVEGARLELEGALEGLAPERATDVIELVTLLRGSSSRGGLVAARVAGRAHRGEVAAALELLDGELPDVPVDDRPGILALAGRIAEEYGRPREAAGLRGRIVENHPESPEAAEATVRLARWVARSGGDAQEAARMLEELILSRPESAVIPEARRELQRIRGQVPGGER